MRFHLQTFGCKSNQYESQAMREALFRNGHEETDDPTKADILLANTCGVTGRAGAGCRRAIRRALRTNPSLTPVITGCAVDLGEEWTRTLARDGIRVRNARKHAIPSLLEAFFNRRPEPAAADDRFGLSVSTFRGHTRGFLKVQDGCGNRCSYCAVPFARGSPESRPAPAILEEALRLIGNGRRELALTGINIGAYGDGGLGLADLAIKIAELPGLERLRLGSVEPPYVDDRLLEAVASNRAVCPHIHIPLQSGDDGILRAMGRRYSARAFMAVVDKTRKTLPLPSITTDVIVGFPGEDEAAFRNTLDLCREAGFSRLHVFPFSPRPGTGAARLRRTATDRETEPDKRRLLDLGAELAERYARSAIGLRERIIVEKEGSSCSGLTDRYVRATVAVHDSRRGDVVPIRVVGAAKDALLAEAL